MEQNAKFALESNQEKIEPDKNESGNAKVLAIISITALYWYLHSGQQLLNKILETPRKFAISETLSFIFTTEIFPAINIAIIAILGLLAFFTFGYSIHLFISGAEPAGRIKTRTLRKHKSLGLALTNTKQRFRTCEQQMFQHYTLMSSKVVSAHGLLRAIVVLLEKRLLEAEKYLEKGGKGIYYAAELLSRDINLSENSIDTIIYHGENGEIPAVNIAECEKIMDQLISIIETEIELIFKTLAEQEANTVPLAPAQSQNIKKPDNHSHQSVLSRELVKLRSKDRKVA